MSSILDALNKLEEEKAQARRDAEGGEIDPAVAARDLVDEPGWGKGVSLGLTQSRVVALALSATIALLVVTVGVLVYVVRQISTPAAPMAGGNEPLHVAGAPSPELAAPSVPIAPEPDSGASNRDVESPPPVEQSVTPDIGVESTETHNESVIGGGNSEPVSEPVATANVPEPESDPVPVSVPSPAEVSEENTSAPDEGPEPPSRIDDAASLETGESFQVAERVTRPLADPRGAPVVEDLNSTESSPVDIRTYPFFGKSVQLEYGIEKFMLNITSKSNARNPFSFAVINEEKYFTNSRIENSRLKLYEVENNAIALEDIGTGQRYYYRNR